MSNIIEIAVTVKAVTDKAILCEDGSTKAWVPLSMISDYGVRGNDFDDLRDIEVIFIPEWLAMDKGFI